MPPGPPQIHRYRTYAPLAGIYDGVDPALPAPHYPDEGVQELDNLRVGRKMLAETRYGSTVWDTLGGAGNTTFLFDFWTKAGVSYRLAARGGTLYQKSGGSFAAAAGGTGLNTSNIFHGAIISDYLVFTDQDATHTLKQWSVAAGVEAVSQPVAPSTKPGIIKRTFATLEDWSTSWTSTSAGKISELSGTVETPPSGGNAAAVTVHTNAKNESVFENVTAEAINSSALAFWFMQDGKSQRVQFRVGLNAKGEFYSVLDPIVANTWYPIFFPIAGIASINFKDIFCNQNPDATRTLYFSSIYQPGNLQGEYRWRYTHKRSASGQESGLSPISDKADYTIIGVNYKPESAVAMQKCAVLIPTTDSGTDATTDEVVFYRNGGSALELIKDENGQDLWVYVGKIKDLRVLLASSPIAGAGGFNLATGLSVVAGDYAILDYGTATQEVVKILTYTTGTGAVTLSGVLTYAHTSGVTTYQTVFLDNTADTQLDASIIADVARDDPPQGSNWVGRSPDGRIWLFGDAVSPLRICVSNKPTVLRPLDFQVFPIVDPLVNFSPLQGFRFAIAGDSAGDRIMWGGFFNRMPTVLTRRGLYQINAYSQQSWGPEAVVRILDVGCLAGETVQEVDGVLYWVAPGDTPRVVRWDGHSAPENLSFKRINETLRTAPTGDTYWGQWWARAHTSRDGAYYCLFVVPNGSTTPTRGLQWNIAEQRWEGVSYRDSGAALIPFITGLVQDGPTDKSELYACHPTNGKIYKLDDQSVTTDDSQPVVIAMRTKRFSFEGENISKVLRFYLRLSGVTDSITVTVKTGGSEYGETSHAYVISLAGVNDIELYQRLDWDLKGRWVEIYITGSVSNRPKIRELTYRARAFRDGRINP